MNKKILALVVGAVVLSSALGFLFAFGIIGTSPIGKNNPSPTMSGYSFNNNNGLTISLTSAQTGTITKTQVCDSSNNCYSEAITFSYPGKLSLNLNNMVGATFAFQYYSNYTIVLTDSSGNHSFQVHYTDPYGPVMVSFAFSSNNTNVSMSFLGNGTYTQCGHDACGSGTFIRERVCSVYISSCYSETTNISYPGQVSLNLNKMSLSGTAFTFTSGYTYTITLTDPDGASYSSQLTR